MPFPQLIAVIAVAYGSLVALAPLLQLLRMHKVRSANDVSIVTMFIFWTGAVVWGIYGIAYSSFALLTVNAICASTWTATIAVAIHYRRPRRRAASHLPLALDASEQAA